MYMYMFLLKSVEILCVLPDQVSTYTYMYLYTSCVTDCTKFPELDTGLNFLFFGMCDPDAFDCGLTQFKRG